MAVMQTPHGRVIGLILHVEDQPKVEAVEKEPSAAAGTSSVTPQSGATPSPKGKASGKAGRTAKK